MTTTEQRERVVAAEALDLAAYDTGRLNPFGGGDVDWWWDYIRAELATAHEFYQAQVIANFVPVADLEEAEEALEGTEDQLRKANEAFSTLQQENERLREALKPFAERAAKHDAKYAPDDDHRPRDSYRLDVRLGDCRGAARALSPETPQC